MNRAGFIKLLGLSVLTFPMNDLRALEKFSQNLVPTPKMPVLFIGHGSPMNAIEDNQFTKGFKNSVASLVEKPKAILCISAHWYTKGTKITAMEMPKTIHDFGGFPKELFAVEYPAKGDPILAEETKNLLSPTLVELDHMWGLDHGAWSVIKHLYPDADVPVLQLSIDYSQPPSYHFDMAKRLSKLREKGILIVGSGNIIHNLRLVDFQNFNKDNFGYDWAIEVREGINKCLKSGDFKSLLDYQKLGSAYKLAIPTPDHYLPLIFTLGLKEEKDNLTLFNDKLLAGSLSMTSVKIG